ncbi:MAG: hypothetical protein F9K40_11730 [Kofleriaceae bacterium]|nr:MAG: hypothetical protein F9K40_11730 [Kofleriaceae bacterium]MBZ0231809.1 hypothetical protein [Kofleriaceae bacterium]
MRAPLVLAVLVTVTASVGCGSSAPRRTTTATTTVATPAHPPVHVSAFARDQMKSGFAAPVELVDGDGNVVAGCTITYDVWRDQYLVRGADYSFSLVSTIPTALGVCLGGQPTVELTARVELALRGDAV